MGRKQKQRQRQRQNNTRQEMLVGEETQDDVCHILGDEDDADEASETEDQAEVGAEWEEPTARAEPALERRLHFRRRALGQ